MSGNQNHEQQSWEYQDGNNRISMSYQSSSYSSQGRTAYSSSSTPLSPAMPALQATPFHGMHQQMHTAAMQHHQSAMQQFNDMHQSMQANMLSMNTTQMMQPQLSFSGTQMQLPAPAQRRTIRCVREVDTSGEESSDDDAPTLQRQQQLVYQPQQSAAQQQAYEQKYAADRQELEAQRRAMEQRYNADQQSIQRQGAKMNERLVKLEAKETKNRAEQEAKDAELLQLRNENSRLAQQRYQDAEKHRDEMSELVRMQAKKPQAAAPVFDTSALEKVIREVQAQQLSKSDIEKVIQERVADQLQGLAKKKDIEAAGSQMQSALKMMPSGASLGQIQQAVNQELGKAVTSLSSKMSKQRMIEPTMPPAIGEAAVASTMPRYDVAYMVSSSSSRALPSMMQQPQPLASTQVSSMPQIMPAPLMPQQKQLAMPPIEQSPMVAPSVISKVKKDKSKSVITRQSRAITQTSPNDAQAASSALPAGFPDASSKISSGRGSKSSRHDGHVLPSVDKALSTMDAKSRISKSSKHTAAPMPLAKLGEEHALSFGSSSGQALPADFPDTASKISSWARSKAKKSSKHVMPTIEEPESMIYSPSKHLTRALPAIEQAPPGGVLVKAKQAVPTIQDTSEDVYAKSTVSAPINTALVKNSAAAFTMPSVAVMNMPQMGMTMSSMHQEFSLPADFPDTASQVSTWERGRAATGLAGAAALPAIQAASGGQQLVRSDKHKSSKK